MGGEGYTPLVNVPVLSFSFKDAHIPNLGSVANYVEKAEFWSFGVTLDGKISGQPFRMSYPNNVTSDPNANLYVRLDLPMHRLKFYDMLATRNKSDPVFAVNYTEEQPEERDDERKKVINRIGIYDVQGRLVLDSDGTVEEEELAKLRDIVKFLRPTAVTLYRIGWESAILHTGNSNTLDTIVVP
jgi:hypothetical protein